MLDVLLLQLDMCCNNQLHQGLCLGWCLAQGIPMKRLSTDEELAVPVKLNDVDFYHPMDAMCRCIQYLAGKTGLQARACWA